jgi:hypothetical protein
MWWKRSLSECFIRVIVLGLGDAGRSGHTADGIRSIDSVRYAVQFFSMRSALSIINYEKFTITRTI